MRDTGRGIEPEFLQYVFERFRQEGANGRRSSGLGLGLAIVRHLVEMHGGEISAASEGRGKGSTFTFSLPTNEPSAGRETGEVSQATVTRLDGLSVLVVEDEPDSRDLIAPILEQRGANVVKVESAGAARMCLADSRPQVIVSDIDMPDEDGYAFARSIRDLPGERGGHLPLIALTACASANERRRALDAGFNNHVQKPLNPEELAGVIRNAVVFGPARFGI